MTTTMTYTYTDDDDESSEDREPLGSLKYQQPENAKKGDVYIPSISVYIESDLPLSQPGVEFWLEGSLRLFRLGDQYGSFEDVRINLDDRSIIYDSGPRFREKIDAINVEQVIEDVEGLLVG